MKRFKLGQRVQFQGMPGIQRRGALGVVDLVAGVRGKSIYCDPSRMMVFVRWDDGRSFGVFRWELGHPSGALPRP